MEKDFKGKNGFNKNSKHNSKFEDGKGVKNRFNKDKSFNKSKEQKDNASYDNNNVSAPTAKASTHDKEYYLNKFNDYSAKKSYDGKQEKYLGMRLLKKSSEDKHGFSTIPQGQCVEVWQSDNNEIWDETLVIVKCTDGRVGVTTFGNTKKMEF